MQGVVARQGQKRSARGIPDDLLSTEAAPLLCAGLTTFKGLRNSKARPGELVAIQGVGGLGHLGIQFARRMGFQVAAIARGSEKESLAKKLGAHHYIDSSAQDPVAASVVVGHPVFLDASNWSRISSSTPKSRRVLCLCAKTRLRSGPYSQTMSDMKAEKLRWLANYWR